MQAAFKFHQKEKINLVHHFSSFLAAAVSSGSLMMDALISWRRPLVTDGGALLGAAAS